MRRLLSIARYLLRRRREDEDLDEEMRLHIELRAMKLAESGVAPGEAARAARKQFGGTVRMHEQSREIRIGAWLASALQDLRYALRMLRRSPLFTAAAVLTLALGIGANTAIFTLIDAYLLRPLPVRDPSPLVELAVNPASGEDSFYAFPFRAVELLSSRAHSISGVFAWNETTFAEGRGADTRRINGAVATGAVWQTLGIQAQAGRLFGPEDDTLASPPVAVISDGYWNAQYHRRASAIGSGIILDRTRFTIIGVLPRDFRCVLVGGACDVTVPFLGRHPAPRLIEQTTEWWLSLFARLAPGATEQMARAELAALSPGILEGIEPHLTASEEKEFLKQRLDVIPAAGGGRFFVRRYRKPLLALIGVSAIVLLIGCLNLANLMLARAASRQRELAVRLALGASRKRLIRQFVIESALLAVAGAAIGSALAVVATRAALNHLVVADVTPDLRILAFLACVSMAATLLFGLLPALRGTDLRASDALKQSRPGSSPRSTAPGLLVSAQVALSVVLILGAFLFIQTFQRLAGQDTGFDRHNLIFIGLDAGKANPGNAERKRFFADVLGRVRQLPFVRSASLTAITPLEGSYSWDDLPVELWPGLSETERRLFEHRVESDYFRTVGLRVLQGRDFNEADSGQHAAILSAKAARTYFPGKSPIGRTLRIKPAETWRIVGVVEDAKYQDLREPAPRTMYLYVDDPSYFNLVIRSRAGAGPVVSSVHSIVRALNPAVAIDEAVPLDELIRRGTQIERLVATIASFFAVVAGLLVAIGLYGVVGYAAARRTTEIGVRMALGGTRARILWLVLRDALLFAAIGVSVGIPAAIALARTIASLFYETSAFDAGLIAATASIALALCALAAFIPARRAAALDPMTALRWE